MLKIRVGQKPSSGFPDGSVGRVRLPMQETLVRSLGQEDPLEQEMATHSSILAWKIPGTEKPGGVQSMGLQRIGPDPATKHTTLNQFLSWWKRRLEW